MCLLGSMPRIHGLQGLLEVPPFCRGLQAKSQLVVPELTLLSGWGWAPPAQMLQAANDLRNRNQSS